MSGIDRHAPGTFCWVECGTTDPALAKTFYTALFDWQTVDSGDGSGGTYTTLLKNDRMIGGLYGLDPEMDPEVPSSWLSYLAVEDADAAVREAIALGGQVLLAPRDVMEHGRMAMLEDPSGARFAVWQPKQLRGAEIVNEPGAVCWTELGTRDVRRAGEFYSRLFGWTAETQNLGGTPYTMFRRGSLATAGMWTLPPELADVPPHWLPYFAVQDCEESAGVAQIQGGTLIVPPNDVPGIGRFAVLQDPAAAFFAVIKLRQEGMA